jgi:hypothetical protein
VSRRSILLAVTLCAAVLWVGCDLFMKQLSKGPEPAGDTDDADSGPDGGVDWCPGYEGEDECCDIHDTCGWANDDYCDCDGFCDWDDADCGGGDTDTDTDSDTDTDDDGGAPDGGVWCVGYTGDDPCCLIDDPCDYAGDDYCDCDATCDWDWEDC